MEKRRREEEEKRDRWRRSSRFLLVFFALPSVDSLHSGTRAWSGRHGHRGKRTEVGWTLGSSG